MRLRTAVVTTPFLVLFAGAAGAVVPSQVVSLELQDATTDPSIGHMRIIVDQATVKPGRVRFEAVNESKTLTHEVIVVHQDGKLPFDARHDRVDEHDIRRLGEIPELTPGKTGELTLNLGPGTYVMFCNEPGHYHDGMVANLVVQP